MEFFNGFSADMTDVLADRYEEEQAVLREMALEDEAIAVYSELAILAELAEQGNEYNYERE